MGENCRDFDFCPHSTKPSVSLILNHMDVLAAKMRTRCVKSSHTETSPPPPSSPVHAFILVFLHPILPIFQFQRLREGEEQQNKSQRARAMLVMGPYTWPVCSGRAR